MNRYICGLLAALALLVSSSGEAGIRPVMKIREFRGYRSQVIYGVPPSVKTAAYYWAVYQPHLYRVEERFRKQELDYGPAWVAKRRSTTYTHWNELPPPAYDFLTVDGQSALVSQAHAVFWWNDNPPPPVEFYWPDRQAPAWFVSKHYDLFYPLEGKKWWARSGEGKWDLIDEGKLASEAGKGPEIEVPRIIFRWR